MQGSDQRWVWVRRQARQFLQRFNDPGTRSQVEDLAQDAALVAWLWVKRVRDPRRLGAAVRTIARRLRNRERLTARRRFGLIYTEFGLSGVAEPAVVAPDEPGLSIDGRNVALDWAMSRLPGVLDSLPGLDRQLLLGFHEGFCCAELAHRYGRTEDCVKTRIHRARRRIRMEFEAIVRAADDLDGCPKPKE